MDSDTTRYFSNDKAQFIKLDEIFIELASIADSKKKLPIKNKKTVRIKLDSKHGITIFQIKNVYYSLTVRINLLFPSIFFHRSGIWGQ